MVDAGGASVDVARQHLATESLAIWWEHPLGVGWGDLGEHLSSQATISLMGDAQYPHNILLEVSVEGGILGLLGLVVLLVASLRRLLTIRHSVTGSALLGLWVFALAGAMTSSDVVGNRLVFLMIGVGLSVPIVATSPSTSTRSPPTPSQTESTRPRQLCA